MRAAGSRPQGSNPRSYKGPGAAAGTCNSDAPEARCGVETGEQKDFPGLRVLSHTIANLKPYKLRREDRGDVVVEGNS